MSKATSDRACEARRVENWSLRVTAKDSDRMDRYAAMFLRSLDITVSPNASDSSETARQGAAVILFSKFTRVC